MKPVILVRRVYDEPKSSDGCRILVDRLWPRGLTRENAALDDWAKLLAPSTELRKWYHHSADLWNEFQNRYVKELNANKAEVERFLAKHQNQKRITLLYGTKSLDHNHALVLKQFLEKKIQAG